MRALAIGLALLLSATEAAARRRHRPDFEGDPKKKYGMIQEPVEPQPHPGRGLLIAGSVTFGVLHAVGVVLAVTAGKNASASAYYGVVPIVGPLFYLAESKNPATALLHVFWSAGQLTGVLLLIVGGRKSSDTASTRVVPMVGATNGIAVVGVF